MAPPDVKSIFGNALNMASPAARAAYLDEACRDHPGLRAEVEDLLAALERASEVMRLPAASGVTANHRPVAEGPGTVIGPYHLLQQIGEGGMGTVFMAEQTRPVQRKVALKVIKEGMDTRQVVARFEAERQALAMMDHVNIARVFDAGATDAGRPYFVMELIHGVPITKYCDDNHLTPRERLELFVPVCQAIQHAHQKGIIHRDVKPSNVMVTLYDGKPVPKVIDFGVAKATEQKLTERTLFTQYGTMVGTFEYMSPEQAELSGLGVDTRSDIYSLGVLMYELLTGNTPLSHKRVREAAYAEVLRMIREEETPKPSTRLGDSGEALALISARRHMEPAELTKLVRGELDWIVMKCLEKDRNRRYETASGFAADVQRYLNDEPVQACPPSVGYRLRKFARKNRRLIYAAGTFVLLLLTGAVVSTWQAVRASRERDRAVQAEADTRTERDRALAEQERADDEAAIARAVSDFLQNDLLAEAAPDKNARNKQVTVEEVLGRAAARIAGKFEKQPRIEAAIRQTIGDTYRELGNYPAAQPHLERALELHRHVRGEEHPDTLTSMNNLALLYVFQSEYGKAEPLLVKAINLRRRILGEEHNDTLSSMNNLALLVGRLGQTARAESLFVKILEVRRRVPGEEHLDTLVCMSNLAALYRYTELSKAEPLFVKALEGRRRVLGEEHPDTLSSTANLAALYRAQSQFSKAEPLFVKALEGRRRVLGEGHPDTLMSMNGLAGLYWSTQKLDRSIPLFEESLQLSTAHLAPDDPNTLVTMVNLGINYLDAGRSAESIPLLELAIERIRKRSGALPSELAFVPSTVAAAYERAGQFATAEPLRREALETMRKRYGEGLPPVAGALSVLGQNLLRQKKHGEAEPVLRECLKIRETKLPDDWSTFDTRSMLGCSLLGQKRYAEAEPLLLAGYEGMKRREAKIPAGSTVRFTQSLEWLVQLYEATGKKDKSAEWRKRLEQPKDPPKP